MRTDIKKARLLVGWNQDDAAAGVGVSLRTWKRWESAGSMPVPATRLFHRLLLHERAIQRALRGQVTSLCDDLDVHAIFDREIHD